MSEAAKGGTFRKVLGGVILALALVSAASAALRVSEFGLGWAVGDALVSVYIAGLVVWGFFKEGFDTDRFRALLYFGLVLWGTVDMLAGRETAFTYLLIIGGSLLLARVAYKYSEKQKKPVYER